MSAAEARSYTDALAEVLLDCVAGGASVSFMAPFSIEDSKVFFENAVLELAAGKRILLAAFLNSQLVGTVQILTAMPPNQPHRGEVTKLLVHRSARSRGVGLRLMECVEEAAVRAGKTLLVLDTASASAETIYVRLGWTRLGVIPNYALLPDGEFCDTTVFYKQLK